MRKINLPSPEQDGFASITVSFILVLLLALLTLGFAQLARREQANTLDHQLATQAAYAAESGVNDVIRQLHIDPNVYAAIKGNKDKCVKIQNGDPANSANQNAPLSSGVSYGCVLVDAQPKDVAQGYVKPGEGRSSVFNTVSNVDNLTFDWGPVDPNHNNFKIAPTPNQEFNPAGTGQWGDSPAVIQLSITPLNTITRSALQNNTFTVYLYPSKPGQGTNTISYSNLPADQGQIISGSCTGTGTYPCRSIINLPAGSSFLIHFVNFYDISNVDYSGRVAGTAQATKNTQASVDVTGKARDVLKRITVRVPMDNTGGSEGVSGDFAVQGSAICKRFTTEPTSQIVPYTPGGFSSCNLTDTSPTGF